MIHKTLTLGVVTSLFLLTSCVQTPPVVEATLSPASPYPVTETVAQTDNYFGTTVADPYRWLEQMDSPAVQQWVTAQNALAKPMLESLSQRQALKERLTALWNYERIGTPFRHGER